MKTTHTRPSLGSTPAEKQFTGAGGGDVPEGGDAPEGFSNPSGATPTPSGVSPGADRTNCTTLVTPVDGSNKREEGHKQQLQGKQAHIIESHKHIQKQVKIHILLCLLIFRVKLLNYKSLPKFLTWMSGF